MNVRRLSRRELLRATGIAGGVLVLGASIPLRAIAGAARHKGFSPNVFVAFEADGTVLITASRTEMGQGVRTSLPRVVADELEADWSRVRVVQANGDGEYGDQNTDGSKSVRMLFEPCRWAGATAREMLIKAASLTWGVDHQECQAVNHGVVHLPSGRRLEYADLLHRAATLLLPPQVQLKPESEFKLIGKSIPSVDLEDIVRGRAGYGFDARLDRMQYACIARCPVLGGSLGHYDAGRALAVRGVRAVREIPGTPYPTLFYPKAGVAVVADNTWAAIRGRDALQVTWNDGDNGDYDSTEFAKVLVEATRRPGHVRLARGDVDRALMEGGNIVEATYETPMLAHTSMEPPVALADVRGDRCEVWAPVQDAQDTRRQVAEWLNIPLQNVTVHVPLAGGGFGRKSKPDFALEAVELSRQTGTPVKVSWTREDDVRHDYLHAQAAQYMKAMLGKDGLPTAWLMRAAYPTIDWLWEPTLKAPMEWELGMGLTNMPYDVANVRIEGCESRVPIRTGWIRSVCNIFHGFAINAFVDEMATAAGADLLAYRLQLLGPDRVFPAPNEPEDSFNGTEIDTARVRGVLQRVADETNWGKRLPDNHFRGIAVINAFFSYVATVLEIEMLGNKDFRVVQIDTAVDCGIVVNPDGVQAQVEGANIFGLGIARYGEIHASNGRVLQGNFNDYRIPRIHEAPPVINCHIVASSEPPSGIGEPATPLVAPALAGALFAATGKRERNLPIKLQRT